ncbi:hypothetical protein ABEB36_013752 [Hypothenemus hampei]|uniref:Transposable element P transposase-like RNase H C-terminal domain-containing protein n=1 Tax=Hypothenemus hampei TaxID=57062 RepID=A0ABD1E630_HYPHA
MSFINKKRECQRVPCLNNWVVTLNSLEELMQTLKKDYGVGIFKTRHVNQDPIENFFGQIRQQGCRNTNPTAKMFASHFKTLLINNLVQFHSLSANCQEVPGSMLSDVNIFLNSSKNVHAGPKSFSHLQTISIGYVSGWLSKFIKSLSKCECCKNNIFTSNREDNWHALVAVREYSGVSETNVDFKFIDDCGHKSQVMRAKFCKFFCFNWAKGLSNILCGKEARIRNNIDPIARQARGYFLKRRKQ